MMARPMETFGTSNSGSLSSTVVPRPEHAERPAPTTRMSAARFTFFEIIVVPEHVQAASMRPG